MTTATPAPPTTCPRYQYDPTPRVRDAMAHIWRSLVDDPRKAGEWKAGRAAGLLFPLQGCRPGAHIARLPLQPSNSYAP